MHCFASQWQVRSAWSSAGQVCEVLGSPGRGTLPATAVKCLVCSFGPAPAVCGAGASERGRAHPAAARSGMEGQRCGVSSPHCPATNWGCRRLLAPSRAPDLGLLGMSWAPHIPAAEGHGLLHAHPSMRRGICCLIGDTGVGRAQPCAPIPSPTPPGGATPVGCPKQPHPSARCEAKSPIPGGARRWPLCQHAVPELQHQSWGTTPHCTGHSKALPLSRVRRGRRNIPAARITEAVFVQGAEQGSGRTEGACV